MGQAGLEHTENSQSLLPGCSNDDFDFNFLSYKFTLSYMKGETGWVWQACLHLSAQEP